MAAVAIPQIKAPFAPLSSVDAARFAALERRVEALVVQLQQLGPSSETPGGSNQRFLNGFIPTAPGVRLPITPGISEGSQTPVTPATSSEQESAIAFDNPSSKLALQVLDIIQRYGQNVAPHDIPWAGKIKFLPFVEEYVKNNKPVKMVLPAFPFKSPNRKDKVLGMMPDLGEELALMHLNGLCESITEIYEPGATVTITSDGLVYNDLMDVPDSEVWEYSTAVRDIITAKGLRHVQTLRIVDLLDTHPHSENLTKEEYLIHAGCYRRELVAKYGPLNFDSREAVNNDKDTCMTYQGYIKFLTKDLAHSKVAIQTQGGPKKRYKEAIEKLALKMIGRGKAFAAAIESKCEGYVRLSIHPSVGQTKLSVPLIPPPKGGRLMTPWHSSIAVGIDGSFRTVHADEVRETHDLVLRNGQPYCFRQKSDLFDFGETKVEFEHLYPCGLVIRPALEVVGKPSFRDIDVKKLRKLAELQSPVILRGFADTTDRELYVSKGHELGEVLPWSFGIVQEVKDHGRKDKLHNNVVSNEAMPMHYDGMFKFVNKKDENGNDMKDENGNEIKIQKPPKFQFFTCVSTSPKGTGFTLFAASRLFFQYLPAPYTVARLEAVKWRMDNDGFWDAKLKGLPLVVRHSLHNTPCVRWHEPWPTSKTKYSTCEVTIENDSPEIAGIIDSLLYDRRVCLRFSWEQGDILLSDNVAMLHTRTTFTEDCDRELWRIHFD
ncbi:MAG: hypothetical protein M1840_007090 [Geoglossum simile]|nr:MAG: hypothetical protein M1840_007090 [Geoglossum simile]